MPNTPSLEFPTTAVAVRTLLAAGFTITNSQRQPCHIEIECERIDSFGITIPYLVAVCETDEPPDDISFLAEIAKETGRNLAVVARESGSSWLSWNEFLESLGGAVPSWRALADEYLGILQITATNQVPLGMKGEAWQIFEDAVADGLEFVLGQRVRRMGGKKRGKRVSDMIAQIPNSKVLVVDAKASGHAFDLNWTALRPLVEYTNAQKLRQRGQLDVGGAVLVAAAFKQPSDQIVEVAGDFQSETSIPLVCLNADTLASMVKQLSFKPHLRNAINWAKIFCRSGVVAFERFQKEVDAAESERYPRGLSTPS